MRALVNFGGILLIVLLMGLVVAAYRFFKNSDPDNLENDPDVSEEELEKAKKPGFFKSKGKKTDEQETVLINMPVLSWKYPGGEWEMKELSKVHTTIGRDSDCDIVINHPTVSMKHAEVIMKIRKMNAETKGARYFLLKNHSKENPISFLNAEGGSDDWRDIIRSIPLTYSENAFFLGLVEMRIIFPAQKRVLSEGPDLWAREAQKAEPKSAESKNAEQKAAEWKNTEQKAARTKNVGQKAEKERTSALDQERENRNQPEIVVDPELIRAQRKVIRRSPRSGNRI